MLSFLRKQESTFCHCEAIEDGRGNLTASKSKILQKLSCRLIRNKAVANPVLTVAVLNISTNFCIAKNEKIIYKNVFNGILGTEGYCLRERKDRKL